MMSLSSIDASLYRLFALGPWVSLGLEGKYGKVSSMDVPKNCRGQLIGDYGVHTMYSYEYICSKKKVELLLNFPRLNPG